MFQQMDCGKHLSYKLDFQVHKIDTLVLFISLPILPPNPHYYLAISVQSSPSLSKVRLHHVTLFIGNTLKTRSQGDFWAPCLSPQPAQGSSIGFS